MRRTIPVAFIFILLSAFCLTGFIIRKSTKPMQRGEIWQKMKQCRATFLRVCNLEAAERTRSRGVFFNKSHTGTNWLPLAAIRTDPSIDCPFGSFYAAGVSPAAGYLMPVQLFRIIC
jgi:hypothetical protein